MFDWFQLQSSCGLHSADKQTITKASKQRRNHHRFVLFMIYYPKPSRCLDRKKHHFSQSFNSSACQWQKHSFLTSTALSESRYVMYMCYRDRPEVKQCLIHSCRSVYKQLKGRQRSEHLSKIISVQQHGRQFVLPSCSWGGHWTLCVRSSEGLCCAALFLYCEQTAERWWGSASQDQCCQWMQKSLPTQRSPAGWDLQSCWGWSMFSL